jgi:hypothetical protein
MLTIQPPMRFHTYRGRDGSGWVTIWKSPPSACEQKTPIVPRAD